MNTDAKTMAEVLRKVADNIENGIQLDNNVQMEIGNDWQDRICGNIHFPDHIRYRIKPQTITVNGVEIPKPLDISELDANPGYYTPFLCDDLYISFQGFRFRSAGIKLAYKTKEEAIEASKKLFGIE